MCVCVFTTNSIIKKNQRNKLLYEYTSKFWGFMSLWHTPMLLWRYASALNIYKLRKGRDWCKPTKWYKWWVKACSHRKGKKLTYYIEIYLIRIKFHIYQWHPLIHFVVVSDHPIDSLRNILKYQVKIKLIFFSCWEETMLQRHNIRVVQKAHSLQLPVLVSLVLKNLLYSHSFTRLQALGLHNKSRTTHKHQPTAKLQTYHPNYKLITEVYTKN